MKKLIVTNNRLVYEKFNNEIETIFLEDTNFLDVLIFVRDKVHEGHRLFTHPLSGSLKPNETPYKSIVISKEKVGMDFKELTIIEDSIASTKKFIKDKPTPRWIKRISDDFKLIDLSLITNAIGNMYYCI
jgi:hypothetical protein